MLTDTFVGMQLCACGTPKFALQFHFSKVVVKLRPTHPVIGPILHVGRAFLHGSQTHKCGRSTRDLTQSCVHRLNVSAFRFVNSIHEKTRALANTTPCAWIFFTWKKQVSWTVFLLIVRLSWQCRHWSIAVELALRSIANGARFQVPCMWFWVRVVKWVLDMQFMAVQLRTLTWSHVDNSWFRFVVDETSFTRSIIMICVDVVASWPQVSIGWPPRALAATDAFLNSADSGSAIGYDGLRMTYSFWPRRCSHVRSCIAISWSKLEFWINTCGCMPWSWIERSDGFKFIRSQAYAVWYRHA